MIAKRGKVGSKKRKCRGQARSALKFLSENELKDEHFGDNLVKVPSGWPAIKKLEEDDDYEPPLDDPMISDDEETRSDPKVCALTQFFLFPFCKIINDPSSGKDYSLPFLPATLSSPPRTLEGLFELPTVAYGRIY